MEAKIQIVNEIPRLVVDGKIMAPNILMPVRGPQPEVFDSEVARAGRFGMHLLCVSPFGTVKETIDTVLNDDPDSIIMLRIAFPVDMNALGIPNNNYKDQHGRDRGFYSIASDAWMDYTKAQIADVIAQVADYDKAAEHVIGYHIGAADAGEWLGPFFWEVLTDCSAVNQEKFRAYLSEKYGGDQALRTAWGDESVSLMDDCVPTDMPASDMIEMFQKYGAKEETILTSPWGQRYVDFWDYYNDLVASRICEVMAYTKELTDNKALTAAFYGYHTEARMPNSGQFALHKVLADDNLDMICAPISYLDRNESGKGASMGANCAIISYGKLWVDEADYRSPVRKAEGNSDVAGGLETGGYCQSVDGLLEVVRRQVGKCMVDAGGAWWFDMVGRGWYDFDEFWEENRFLSDLYEKYIPLHKNLSPDIAIISDEYARHAEGDPWRIGNQLGLYMRDAFYKAGLTWGYYLTENILDGHIPDAKLYVFLHPWRLDDAKTAAIKEVLGDKKAVFMYGYGRTSPENFAALCGIQVSMDEVGDTTVYPVEAIGEVIADFGTDPVAGFDKAQQYVCPVGEATVLGCYANGKAAMALSADGNRIFCGGALLTPDQLRALGAYAGGHVFLDSNDVVYANHSLLVIHTCSKGTKNIQFPSVCDVYDPFENRWHERVNTVTCDMENGVTKFFFYGNKADFVKQGIG